MSNNGHGVMDLFSRIGQVELAAAEARGEARAVVGQVKDHEKRIHSLEVERAKVMGAAALGGGIVQFITWLLHFVT